MHLPFITAGRVLLELCEDVAHELEDQERDDDVNQDDEDE
jgi:hypothetical protein